MDEIWKLIQTYKTNTQTHLKGDKVYVSNKGRVKFNDIILDYGKGLYVNNGQQCIYRCKLPENTFHRTIYKLFVGEIKYKGYQIHHIDFNHINNDASNLIQVTPKEHGRLHAEAYKNGDFDKVKYYHNLIEQLENERDTHKESSKQFLIQYTKERRDKLKEVKQQLKEQQKQERQQQKQEQRQQFINDRLSKGWKYNKNGALYNPEVTTKMRSSHTDDWRKKISKSVKQRYIIDPTYRKRVNKKS